MVPSSGDEIQRMTSMHLLANAAQSVRSDLHGAQLDLLPTDRIVQNTVVENEHERFVPVAFLDIPPPQVAEYRTIFDDIDYDNRGFIQQGDLRVAILVNGIDALREARLDLLCNAMEKLSGSKNIKFEAFCRCLYSATLVDRDVKDPALYAVFPDSMFTAETATGLLRLRRSIWLLMDDPMSSGMARLMALLIVITILVSTISFCVETLPGIHKKHDQLFDEIEVWCVSLFTIEFLLRLVCTPEPGKFFKSSLNVIDFLAIVPFYVELMISEDGQVQTTSGSAMLRAVRLVRVFRLIKIGRYLQWMRVFGKTLAGSISPLLMLLFILILMLFLYSTLVYFLERGVWVQDMQAWVDPVACPTWQSGGGPDCAPVLFDSIPSTMWWAIISMAVVGYGDMVPTTPWGKLVACTSFFIGIMISAIPISVISGNFHSEYAHMRRLRALKTTHNQSGGDVGRAGRVEDAKVAAAAAAATAAAAADVHSIAPHPDSLPSAGLELPSLVPARAQQAEGHREEEKDTARLKAGSGTGLAAHEEVDVGPVLPVVQLEGGQDEQVEEEEVDEEEEGSEEGEEGDRAAPMSSLPRGLTSASSAGDLVSTPSAYDVLAAARATRAAQALEERARQRQHELAEMEEGGGYEGGGGGGIDRMQSIRSTNSAAAAAVQAEAAADLARAAALRELAKLTLGEGGDEGLDGLTPAQQVLRMQQRIDASWSEPFLRTALQVVRNSRRGLMTKLKQCELSSREKLCEDVEDSVGEIGAAGGIVRALKSASKTGLV